MSSANQTSQDEYIRGKPVSDSIEFERYIKALTKLNLYKVDFGDFPLNTLKRLSRLNEDKQDTFIRLLMHMRGDLSYSELYQQKSEDIERLLCAFSRLEITQTDVRQIILPVELYEVYRVLPQRKQEQFVRFTVDRHHCWVDCGEEYDAVSDYLQYLLHQQEGPERLRTPCGKAQVRDAVDARDAYCTMVRAVHATQNTLNYNRPLHIKLGDWLRAASHQTNHYPIPVHYTNGI